MIETEQRKLPPSAGLRLVTIRVRPATTDDHAAIAGLLGELYGRPTEHSLPIIRQQHTTLTAEVDGRVAGLAVGTRAAL